MHGPMSLPLTQQLSNKAKNVRSSDINLVSVKQSNKSGDGALFIYRDTLIVSASVKVGITKCITVSRLPS